MVFQLADANGDPNEAPGRLLLDPGLVGHDLLLDLVDAVVAEDGSRAFALADRAVESGHDLRLVCRELSRVVRDMMVLSVDPARAGDGELAGDERERLTELAGRFSREDLMRAFDLLAKAELDIRNASQPRYHFEMVLLRWMHLRKLVPLTELMEQLGSGSGRAPAAARTVAPPAPRTVAAPAPRTAPATPRATPSPGLSALAQSAKAVVRSARAEPPTPAPAPSASPGGFKDAFLAEIRAGKGFFYNTVVAQAQRIDFADDRVTFTFLPTHRALREQFDQTRAWLESTAERVIGRRVAVVAVQSPAAEAAEAAAPAPVKAEAPKRDLKAEAMSSTTVQAMLDVFPAEIRDVEEM